MTIDEAIRNAIVMPGQWLRPELSRLHPDDQAWWRGRAVEVRGVDQRLLVVPARTDGLQEYTPKARELLGEWVSVTEEAVLAEGP